MCLSVVVSIADTSCMDVCTTQQANEEERKSVFTAYLAGAGLEIVEVSIPNTHTHMKGEKIFDRSLSK